MKAWEDCVAFHGHECGGLTIGYKASLYAAQLLGLTFSEDEQVVCVAENDACGIDAIQVMLGCSMGKGNLILCLRGKSAYSFYDRKSGKSVRLVLKPRAGMTREESFSYYQACPLEEMFEVKAATVALPEKAKLFESHLCDGCGELTGTPWLRQVDGKRLCLDCMAAADEIYF